MFYIWQKRIPRGKKPCADNAIESDQRFAIVVQKSRGLTPLNDSHKLGSFLSNIMCIQKYAIFILLFSWGASITVSEPLMEPLKQPGDVLSARRERDQSYDPRTKENKEKPTRNLLIWLAHKTKIVLYIIHSAAVTMTRSCTVEREERKIIWCIKKYYYYYY